MHGAGIVLYAHNSIATRHVSQMLSRTLCRLRNLSEMLGKHIDYLRAAVALESLNTSSDEPSKGADEEGSDDKPVQGDDAPQTS